MSFHLSWIAVKGSNKETVLSALDLVEAQAEPRRPMWALAELGEWLIVLAEDFNYPTPARMAAVSVAGSALACSIDERVMYSVARLYEHGKAVWSVDHNGGEKGLYHLDIAGDPPPELASIRARVAAEQDAEGGESADVDLMFDVPSELSLALCGYRFDPQEEGPAFKALERAKGVGGGWLAKLFGRK